MSFPPHSSHSTIAVQATSTDASVSRDSAARLGYIDDKFTTHFVKRPSRRSPIINRGTYCRFIGIQRILQQFIAKSQGSGQIVSLGCGFDTSYFLLKSKGLVASKFIEIDFAETTAKKTSVIWRRSHLKDLLPEDAKIAKGGVELHSSEYMLISGDLRNFEAEVVPKLIDECRLDLDGPTLFLSECVLVYIDPTDSDRLLEWISKNIANAGIVLYEQVMLSGAQNDRFGGMMVENLRARGLELPSLSVYPDIDSMRRRFSDRGWGECVAVDLCQFHKEYVGKSELNRIARIEMLDEWEEFDLLTSHYCFAFACVSGNSLPFSEMTLCSD